MAEFIEVHTTIDSKEGAQKIAEAIVFKRLAACVQVSGPITSIYWWQGKMEQAEEWVCTAKTRRDLYNDLEQTIREVHTYDVPEILVVGVIAGNAGYLDWILQETNTNLSILASQTQISQQRASPKDRDTTAPPAKRRWWTFFSPKREP